MLGFYSEEFVAPHPTSKLEDHPSTAISDLNQYIDYVLCLQRVTVY